MSEQLALLPSPAARDHKGKSLDSRGGGPALPDVVDWDKYEPAIRRHEAVFGEAAPFPKDDEDRLSPDFVRWMMTYEPGWLNGVSRTGQLRALGNAIVPRQAATAWAHLLGVPVSTEAGGGHARLPTPRSSDSNGAGTHGDGGPDLRTVIRCL